MALAIYRYVFHRRLLHHEDGRGTLFLNISKLPPDCTMSHPYSPCCENLKSYILLVHYVSFTSYYLHLQYRGALKTDEAISFEIFVTFYHTHLRRK
jgi:hypothetical protein